MRFIWLLAVCVGLIVSLGGQAQAQNTLTRTEIEQIVEDYIMNNPETILNSVDQYTANQRARAEDAATESLEVNRPRIFDDGKHPFAGNPNGNVTIVEFFDYNCGYCKKALANIMTLLGEDPELKVIFIDLPILGASSEKAARWSLAAADQNLYFEFHVALMENSGRVTDGALMSVAEQVGMDMDKAQAYIQSDDVRNQLLENLDIATQIGISGTPGFIFGDEIIRGYIEVDEMRKGIEFKRQEAAKF